MKSVQWENAEILRGDLIEAVRALKKEQGPGIAILGSGEIFRYELRERGEETTLVVTYRRITAATARGFLPGTHVFLDRLEAQLDGTELPEWFARFREVRDEYPEWRGDHAPAAGE